MKTEELEGKIRKAMEKQVPDALEDILSRCEDEKGKVISMEEKKNKKYAWKALSAAAVIFLAIGLFYYGSISAVSMVYLDVNPSIEMQVNAKEKITSVKPLNDDAEKILGDMNLKNADLDVGVNAIVGSMLKNGYLSEISNSILVSVEDKNHSRSDELQEKIGNQIEDILSASQVNAAVLSQNVENKSDEVSEISEKFGVSKGKAELMMAIMENDPVLTPEKLSKLTINELNLLMNSNDIKTEKIKSRGTPSDEAYIEKADAAKTALKDAGIKEADDLKVKLDTENGSLVYEVEFIVGDTEYEYEIDALTGKITEKEAEPLDKKDSSDIDDDDDDDDDKKDAEEEKALREKAEIKPEKAEKIILNAMGKEKNKDNFKLEIEEDDGKIFYEGKLKENGLEYEVKIDASTGEIVEQDQEKDDDDDDKDDDEDDDNDEEDEEEREEEDD